MDPDVNYDELARSTDDFNGAQCKAVCVEAGIVGCSVYSVHNRVLTVHCTVRYTVQCTVH